MGELGLFGVFPGKNLSNPAEDHRKYPYLLITLEIDRYDLVWATDITYIRVGSGFLYLTAVLDWHSRYVLSWKLSNTLDVTFCLSVLKDTLRVSKPEIFNTDPGSRYTSKEFTTALEIEGIKISMDGKGRTHDNIMFKVDPIVKNENRRLKWNVSLSSF